MSAPVKHADNENVDDLSFYAPPGARRVPRPTPQRPRLFEGYVLINAVWQRLAGDPDLIPEPPLQQERRPTVVPMLLRTSLLVAVAGCIALVVTLVSLPDSRPSALKQDKAMI